MGDNKPSITSVFSTFFVRFVLDPLQNMGDNKPHLFRLTQHRFILFVWLPVHVCYMFRPVLAVENLWLS
jgi:hypothetical protein